MTGQYLSESLNLLSDDLLYETDRARLAPAKKKHSIRNWSALTACLCILAVGAAVVTPHFSPIVPGPNTENPIISPGEVVPDTPGTTAPEVEVTLRINTLNGVGVADMDLKIKHYDKLPYDVWQMVLAEFHENTDIPYEDFTTRFPEGWQKTNFYSHMIRGYKDGVRSEEYDTLHDYVFTLENGDGGSATVAICPFETPLRDCFFVSENPKESTINGTPLVIHGDSGLYMTSFFHEGLYYDIELSGISKSELEEFLVALIVTE